jgi:dehydrogenase/reductase SDR family member 7B
MSANTFNNKVVWITGASSGIGESMAKAFAEMNARLVLSARRKSELERVAQQCKQGCEILILPFDLSNIESFPENVKAIINRFGRIDILMNNGGISQRSKGDETPLEIDRKLMEINYFANIALTKSVLPIFKSQQSGSIVVLSSVAGKFGFFYRTAYSASKHALHGFYEALRLEQESNGVKVLIVCPGYVKTNISINAITSDGNAHNRMDENQAKGMSADDCARQIIKGLINNKMELIIGGKEVLPVFIKRFFPALFYRIIRKHKPADF